MSKLLVALMSKFIKTKPLHVNNNGSNSIKTVNELLMINVYDPKNCKPLKIIDIGTKAKSYFSEALEISCGEKKFWQNCLESYQAFTSYLKLKLPWESAILKNAIFLDPSKKGSNKSLGAVLNLTIEVCKSLEVKFSHPVHQRKRFLIMYITNGEFIKWNCFQSAIRNVLKN